VSEKPFDVDLAVIRRMATVLPGALPLAVNGVRVAASIRPKKFVIAGGDDSPVTMPRTAFQVVYPDCTVMLDSGFDKATHDSFSPDKPEPYFPEQFVKLERALNAARFVVLTHHHADHVGGVVTASNFSTLAAKTVITMDVADCLMNTPHRPYLKLTQAAIEKFIVLDYPKYYPVAPGMVLIRSPGHSTDSQMVYMRLQSGREILHSVDAAWNLENVLHLVKQPMLVIHGARDRLFPPAQAERIAREAPNATLVMYPDGNHVCNNIAYKYRPLMADWLSEQLR